MQCVILKTTLYYMLGKWKIVDCQMTVFIGDKTYFASLF